jgi:diguanylate cyclase (GGDEF)-like protein/PAS domain S-box-containing protein
MGKALRVLLVEDSEDDAELIISELRRGGFSPVFQRVETLDSMRHALSVSPWDVILSDYDLYPYDALDTLATLQETNRDLPFIIVSGAVEAEQAMTALKSGAHDFLNKDSLARLVPAIERELREANERIQRRNAEERVRILSLAVEQSPVTVMITDRDGRIEYVNPKFVAVTGYQAAEAVGRKLDFTQLPTAGNNPLEGLWATMREGAEWRGEFCNLRKDGQLFWEIATVSPLTADDGAITHFVAVKEDITVRRSYEDRLLRQAHYDELTGLPNRLLMQDRLMQALAAARRGGHRVAALIVDLDRFKNVNDTHGHAAGDRLLREAAERLASCVRQSDTLARMGGDEFVLILQHIDGAEAAENVANRVCSLFARPFRLDGQEHFVTASVGITLFPDDGTDSHELLRNADLAMYQAKERGRNGYAFFTQEINEKLQRRMAIEGQLRKALGNNELLLHYQPILDLRSNQPVAMEALVRWRQRDGKFIMPSEFIPVAEDVGLIHSIGDWVVNTSCHAAVGLAQLGPPALRVAVNVSPRQLRDAAFGPSVLRLLQSSGIAPDRLELEITENVLMEDAPETDANLKMLCDMGVRLSIDDFGTGYSALGYLQKYPFDTLKIDRSFISTATTNVGSARLVETIIGMAHGLGLQVIAEGVETAEQLAFLRSRDCDLAQGFLISRPIAIDELPERLRAIAGHSGYAIA